MKIKRNIISDYLPKKEGQARRSVPEVNTDGVTPVRED